MGRVQTYVPLWIQKDKKIREEVKKLTESKMLEVFLNLDGSLKKYTAERLDSDLFEQLLERAISGEDCEYSNRKTIK